MCSFSQRKHHIWANNVLHAIDRAQLSFLRQTCCVRHTPFGLTCYLWTPSRLATGFAAQMECMLLSNIVPAEHTLLLLTVSDMLLAKCVPMLPSLGGGV
jgi:hypothetical protein